MKGGVSSTPNRVIDRRVTGGSWPTTKSRASSNGSRMPTSAGSDRPCRRHSNHAWARAGDGKSVSPARQDVRDPSEPRERVPANRARRRDARAPRRSRRRDTRGESAAPGWPPSRARRPGNWSARSTTASIVAQPQHGDDHAQPGQTVRHPRQRLRPGENDRGQSAGQITGMSNPDGHTARSLVASHRIAMAARAVQHRPARQRGGRHRQREHAGGIDRWARRPGRRTRPKLNTARKYMNVADSGTDHDDAKPLGASRLTVRPGPRIRSLIVARTSR